MHHCKRQKQQLWINWWNPDLRIGTRRMLRIIQQSCQSVIRFPHLPKQHESQATLSRPWHLPHGAIPGYGHSSNPWSYNNTLPKRWGSWCLLMSHFLLRDESSSLLDWDCWVFLCFLHQSSDGRMRRGIPKQLNTGQRRKVCDSDSLFKNLLLSPSLCALTMVSKCIMGCVWICTGITWAIGSRGKCNLNTG